MEFCDNLRQLLQAYFRDFQLERLERPWSAFTASWSRNAMAKHLGLNATYVAGSHCYVLVRVARHRESGRMLPVQPGVPVEEAVAKDADLVTPGDTSSVVDFVRSFGSHYVASYVTGNSLYQVGPIALYASLSLFPRQAKRITVPLLVGIKQFKVVQCP